MMISDSAYTFGCSNCSRGCACDTEFFNLFFRLTPSLLACCSLAHSLTHSLCMTDIEGDQIITDKSRRWFTRRTSTSSQDETTPLIAHKKSPYAQMAVGAKAALSGLLIFYAFLVIFKTFDWVFNYCHPPSRCFSTCRSYTPIIR